MDQINGWGRYPVRRVNLHQPSTVRELIAACQQSSVIARGNGRSYGDSAINVKNTISMLAFDRILHMTTDNATICCEAGISLKKVIEYVLPLGYFPWVVPGTKYASVGGLIAADAHGKNHHIHGSFSSFLEWIDLIDHSGQIKRCSREENSELFNWTIGGMGLTGIIIRAAFRLRKIQTSFILEKTKKTKNLKESLDFFSENKQPTYSVGWIDTTAKGNALGRGVMFSGEHASVDDLPEHKKSHPIKIDAKKLLDFRFEGPRVLSSQLIIKLMNNLYYMLHPKKIDLKIVSYENFFFPLDRISNWNRFYGRAGFIQIQCVVSIEQSESLIKSIIERMGHRKLASFLSVIKRLGPQNSSLSFPCEGITITFDLPLSQNVLTYADELKEIIIRHGGRFYLAKDSILSPEELAVSDPRISAFREFRESIGARSAFSSVQSQRLGL